jgi:hypothetical protein
MQSFGFATTNDDDKLLITTRISELEEQCENKKQEFNTVIVKLMETNYWPVLQAPDMSGAEEKYQDLKKVVTELKDVVTKINGDLHLIITDRNLDRQSGDQGEPAMDGSRRPAKRRRVDDSEEIGVFQDGSTFEEFENIRDGLANLERRLSDVSNDMTQRDADMMDQIVDVVDAKWEDAGPPLSGVDDFGKLQEVQNNLNSTETDVGGLADEIGKLMIREPELTAEIQQLKKENAKIREDCAAVSNHFPLIYVFTMEPRITVRNTLATNERTNGTRQESNRSPQCSTHRSSQPPPIPTLNTKRNPTRIHPPSARRAHSRFRTRAYWTTAQSPSN